MIKITKILITTKLTSGWGQKCSTCMLNYSFSCFYCIGTITRHFLFLAFQISKWTISPYRLTGPNLYTMVHTYFKENYCNFYHFWFVCNENGHLGSNILFVIRNRIWLYLLFISDHQQRTVYRWRPEVQRGADEGRVPRAEEGYGRDARRSQSSPSALRLFSNSHHLASAEKGECNCHVLWSEMETLGKEPIVMILKLCFSELPRIPCRYLSWDQWFGISSWPGWLVGRLRHKRP